MLLKCVDYKANLEYTITANISGRNYWKTQGTIFFIFHIFFHIYLLTYWEGSPSVQGALPYYKRKILQ